MVRRTSLRPNGGGQENHTAHGTTLARQRGRGHTPCLVQWRLQRRRVLFGSNTSAHAPDALR